jgi:hypothetical protein
MARVRLNQGILRKIAAMTGKNVQSVREKVSRMASRLGIPSEAALLVLAQRHKIGIGRALRRLEPVARQQVRDATQGGRDGRARRVTEPAGQGRRAPDPVGAAISILLTDPGLRSRCADLLRRGKHLDRAVREAATVLESRLRERSGLGKEQERSRSGLVARVLHPDSAIIVVSEDKREQEGVFNLCKGVMDAFGNRLHHGLSEKVTLGEALGLCGTVNVILSLVERARGTRTGARQ